jgi:hypothetical protein
VTDGPVNEDLILQVNFGADQHYWRMYDNTGLEMALRLVPDLERWINLARNQDKSITINVELTP